MAGNDSVVTKPRVEYIYVASSCSCKYTRSDEYERQIEDLKRENAGLRSELFRLRNRGYRK